MPISTIGNDVTQPDSNQESTEELQRSLASQPSPKSWMKFAGLGMELAGATLGFAAIGYLADRYRGNANRYGLAAGALIGFMFGMYRFIQKAMQEINNQSKK